MSPTVSNDVDVAARQLLNDLHEPWPVVFWVDLLTTAVVGWGAFSLAVVSTPFAPLMIAGVVVSAFALYRGLCFTHELTHLRRGSVPGFEASWNLLFGIPLLLPSFTYIGVHQSHHSLSTYGTKDDPEYLPFARSRRLLLTFAVQSSLLIPLLLVVRFLVLSPLGLAWPRFHRWLETYASSFSMNPAYRRTVSPRTVHTMRRWEAFTLVVWACAFALMAFAKVPWRALAVWFVVLMIVSFVNTLRVLGAHEYDSDGHPLDRYQQLKDSIDTPGAPWTELWAPVGLRYHALHHYFPGIPYHCLGTAYRRLVNGLPADAGYRESTSPSLGRSLRHLYAKTGRATASVHDALRDH